MCFCVCCFLLSNGCVFSYGICINVRHSTAIAFNLQYLWTMLVFSLWFVIKMHEMVGYTCLKTRWIYEMRICALHVKTVKIVWRKKKAKNGQRKRPICICVWTCSRRICLNAVACTSTYSRWFLSVDIKTGSFLATWPVLWSFQCTCISRMIQYSKWADLVIPFQLSQRFFF